VPWHHLNPTDQQRQRDLLIVYGWIPWASGEAQKLRHQVVAAKT